MTPVSLWPGFHSAVFDGALGRMGGGDLPEQACGTFLICGIDKRMTMD
jgi:hypothetical protein